MWNFNIGQTFDVEDDLETGFDTHWNEYFYYFFDLIFDFDFRFITYPFIPFSQVSKIYRFNNYLCKIRIEYVINLNLLTLSKSQ